MKDIISRTMNIHMDDRKVSRVYCTPEQVEAFPNHEKYAYSEIFRELLDATNIAYDEFGEALYLLTLRKDITETDLKVYSGRLYPVEISPEDSIKIPAWWQSGWVDPIKLPDGSVRKQHYQCTHCYNISDRAYSYCPYCGAAMQGVK